MIDFTHVLANEIRSDETILWQGQPIAKLVAKLVMRHRLKKMAPRLVFLGFLLLFSYYLSYFGLRHSSLLPFLTVVWVIILAAIVFGTWRIYRQSTRLLYVITNKRILIIQLAKKVTVVSYLKEDLIQKGYTKTYNADGSGTIVFDSTKAKALSGLKDVKQVSAILDSW